MARRPLQVGTWGKISRQEIRDDDGKLLYVVARARFRDLDGKTRKCEARDAKSGAKAEALLIADMTDRGVPATEDLRPDTRMTVVADAWLAELDAEKRISPQTMHNYRETVEKVVSPAVGQLRVREVTVGRIDGFLREVARTRPGTARMARVVLAGMLGLAVRHGALAHNPVRETRALPASHKTVRALTLDEVHALREAVRAWQSDPRQRGPKRAPDLIDIVDVMLGTGCRIGEVLAVRWSDVDLQAAQPTLTVTGTVVRLRGQGLIRQAHPKSSSSRRTVVLPDFVVETLLRTKVNALPNPWDVVFPSSTGTLREPHNLRRQWRSARADTGFEWVTPHSFRRTVATLIARSTTNTDAAAQLGHSGVAVTDRHYIERVHRAPDLTDVLGALAGRGVDERAGKAVDR